MRRALLTVVSYAALIFVGLLEAAGNLLRRN